MREELRRKLPKTRGCGAAIVAAAVVALGVAGSLLWRWISDSPSRVVQKAMTEARHANPEGVKQYLTPESLANPDFERWLPQLVRALGGRRC